jgi:hypothetical protein
VLSGGASPFRDPSPGVLAGALQGGLRNRGLLGTGWFDDGWFVGGSALLVLPRVWPVWGRLSLDVASERGVDLPTGPEASPLPVELEGSFAGAATQVDLAVRELPFLFAGAGAGVAVPVAGEPTRGMHPDFDVDVVGFEQVVAAATAQAWQNGAAGVPSFGGVYDGGYVRAVLGARLGDTIEIPLAAIHEWTALDLPGALQPGVLGWELDAAVRVRAAGWRLSVAFGKLWPGEAVLGTYPTYSLAFRLARNL